MLKRLGILFASILFILSACSQAQPAKKAPGQTAERQGQQEKEPAQKQQPSKTASLPKIDHIVIVIEENHARQQILGNPNAPYMNTLASHGANLTNYHAIEHPSQPNYLDLFSGSNQGVTSDRMPEAKFKAENLAGELIKKGYSFAGYSEDLPSVGYDRETNTKYARKHNPWVNFTNVPKEANQPLKNFPSDFSKLPTVSFVIPNLQHDMHDGTIQEADQWLKNQMSSYVQWAKTHNSLLVVTWDEDNGLQGNLIPTFLTGPMVNPGQYKIQLNHFNLLRTIEDIYGLAHVGQSQSEGPITGIWKNPM